MTQDLGTSLIKLCFEGLLQLRLMCRAQLVAPLVNPVTCFPGSASLTLQFPQTLNPGTTNPNTNIAKAKCAVAKCAKAKVAQTKLG